MPREIVTIQVGQCGNQIGCRFWELALREHAAYNRAARFDDALSSFFRNVDSRHDPPQELPVGGAIKTLKARAVLVDMEEGVVNELLKGPLADIFDSKLHITDVSGAGNNWAHGHQVYGPQYRESIFESIRIAVEPCDSLQSFFLLHSLGGGTGSGLGTYILEQLHDEYPEVFRFTTSIFPSADDDVVTSPYNSLLSVASLSEFADCVLPIENQALQDLVSVVDAASGKKAGSAVTGTRGSKPFDSMNGIAANLLLHLTSSVRFQGPLNVDLNEITTNLVPYPRLHFLMSSMAPIAAPADVGKMTLEPRALGQVFTEVFSRERQLMKAHPGGSTYLACALMLRGQGCTVSDITRNVERIKPRVKMVYWNTEGFKIGLCSTPPVGLPYSLLCLANNCCIGQSIGAIKDRFMKLYKRRTYVHHYTEYMDQGVFDTSAEQLHNLVSEYAALDVAVPPPSQSQFTNSNIMAKLLVLSLLLASAVLLATIQIAVAAEDKCEEEGFFPKTNDCARFYRCVDIDGTLTKYDFQCGPGTMYDRDLCTCVHPWQLPPSDPCYHPPKTSI
ncbi:Epsilon tubulin [Klebsormidium nitens]|uniref:Epsilon tubulin n=1 Tax=Klebsormidium nitens TaxID=105231 RepID=A0A1Y1I3Y1_KLENI|nr:Epsilon tubulin [Klebsormidium nitens]|eukprot:GAQ85193.1 Epsilon tubulin [Klebsormidium nitens]